MGVITYCVIMHNMIVQDERDDSIYNKDWQLQGEMVVPQFGSRIFARWIEFHQEMRHKTAHKQLQTDLVHHIWSYFGNQDMA